MPDICMCHGTNCPLKESCYRYQALPSGERQSYFVTPPVLDGKCNYYWQLSAINPEDIDQTPDEFGVVLD
jgi:hypothetical protein